MGDLSHFKIKNKLKFNKKTYSRLLYCVFMSFFANKNNDRFEFVLKIDFKLHKKTVNFR